MDHRRYEVWIDHQDIALIVAVGVMSFVLTVAALWIGLR